MSSHAVGERRVGRDAMTQRVHHIGNMTAAQALRDKVEHHREVGDAKDDPADDDNLVDPDVVLLERAGHKVAEADGGERDEAIVEAIDERPLLEAREQDGGHDQEDEEPGHQRYRRLLQHHHAGGDLLLQALLP